MVMLSDPAVTVVNGGKIKTKIGLLLEVMLDDFAPIDDEM